MPVEFLDSTFAPESSGALIKVHSKTPMGKSDGCAQASETTTNHDYIRTLVNRRGGHIVRDFQLNRFFRFNQNDLMIM
jgi:hypothetical protein